MKSKQVILLLAIAASALFSACTSVESKTSDEVVIETSSNSSKEEVYITNADVKSPDEQITVTQDGSQLGKRLLSDKSYIETVIDGFGNKIETRYFQDHPRLRMLILRTSASGQTQVTVFGQGSDAKIVSELSDNALTASGDQIANTAGLFATRSYNSTKNFMKPRRTETQTPLQPLPSSAFQKPVVQYNQPVETIEPVTNGSSQTPAVQQNQSKED